jgi:hypothetical protein
MSYINPIFAEEQRRRWLRPDWQRWMREDAHWFAPLSVPETKSQHADADFAQELDAIRADHARVRQMLADVKSELAWRRFVRKYRDDQPRVPAGNPDGGQWTDGGGTGAARQPTGMTIEPARLRTNPRNPTTLPRAPIPILPGITAPAFQPAAALSLYNRLSSQNTDDATAILRFNSRLFEPDPSGDKSKLEVSRLTRDETDQLCPRHAEVRSITDQAARLIDRGAYESPATYGTAVHKWIRDEINGLGPTPRDPDFLAERSVIKSAEARYGAAESIRIDVLENPGTGTVCVYDVKTGASGLSFARMREIADNVIELFPGTNRLVVTEVRSPR